MANPDDFSPRDRPHIRIEAFLEAGRYARPLSRQERKPLRDDYAAHAHQLLDQLAAALGDIPTLANDSRLPIPGLKAGQLVEVTTIAPRLTSKSRAVKIPVDLEFPAQRIEVVRAQRNTDRSESAILFVPDDARPFLADRIRAYGQDPGNKARSDIERFEAVETLGAINGRSLFLGDVDLGDLASEWWELWVRLPSILVDPIARAAKAQNIDVHEDRLIFPDTTVLFLHASAPALVTFAERVPGAISEIRRAKGTIEPFLDRGATGLDQHDWVEDLAQRIIAPAPDAPVVCTLDTGVASAHPLIAPGLFGAWAYDEAWGAGDHDPDGGHGTPLACLALHGDLDPLMNDTRPVALTHGAESMKLIAPPGFPSTKPPSYGLVTQGAVSLVEIERAHALRSFCLACSTTDFPPGRPSSWSGAIDQIASGSMPGELPANGSPSRRLLLVATGNVSGGMAEDVLPSQPLEDPAQSWNALSIGGFTRKVTPPQTPAGLSPAVPANHRSPYSRGSQSLPDDLTPIKPEVLFEAGNMLADQTGFCTYDPAVSLLAAGSDLVTQPLVPFWATSAAVGMAGHFIGRLQAALPDLWPETHRALTVDSAQWPGPIRQKFIGTGAHWKTITKAKMQNQLREFGYGVPDIERAKLCARNDISLIAQAEIQPFAKGADGKSGVFNEVHFYDLPWPRRALEQLENEIVTMKVTLSYFVEPNLNGKAATRPETYRSYGLRFAMKKRGETGRQFRRRISASQASDGTKAAAEGDYWLLGSKAIQAGSLHCDLWRGRAIDLAGHDAVAVYPVGGWWKSHPGQKRTTAKARYALVISILAAGHQIDLHSDISTLVEARVSASVEI